MNEVQYKYKRLQHLLFKVLQRLLHLLFKILQRLLHLLFKILQRQQVSTVSHKSYCNANIRTS